MCHLLQNDEKPKSSFGAICRKTVQFLFSTAGLLVINFAYLGLGGTIFTNLEKYNEEQTCFVGAENYKRAENATTILMLDVASKITNGALQQRGGAEIISDDYSTILKGFSLSVLDVGYQVGKNCSQLGMPGGPQYAWSWSGSLAFALTVTTTIGLCCISYL